MWRSKSPCLPKGCWWEHFRSEQTNGLVCMFSTCSARSLAVLKPPLDLQSGHLQPGQDSNTILTRTSSKWPWRALLLSNPSFKLHFGHGQRKELSTDPTINKSLKLDSDGLNELFKEVSGRSMTRVLPGFEKGVVVVANCTRGPTIVPHWVEAAGRPWDCKLPLKQESSKIFLSAIWVSLYAQASSLFGRATFVNWGWSLSWSSMKDAYARLPSSPCHAISHSLQGALSKLTGKFLHEKKRALAFCVKKKKSHWIEAAILAGFSVTELGLTSCHV